MESVKKLINEISEACPINESFEALHLIMVAIMLLTLVIAYTIYKLVQVGAVKAPTIAAKVQQLKSAVAAQVASQIRSIM